MFTIWVSDKTPDSLNREKKKMQKNLKSLSTITTVCHFTILSACVISNHTCHWDIDVIKSLKSKIDQMISVEEQANSERSVITFCDWLPRYDVITHLGLDACSWWLWRARGGRQSTRQRCRRKTLLRWSPPLPRLSRSATWLRRKTAWLQGYDIWMRKEDILNRDYSRRVFYVRASYCSSLVWTE